MLGILCGMQSEADFVRGPGALVAVTGGQAEAASTQLQTMIRAGATAMVSFGTAGALASGLPAGAIVIAARVVDQNGAQWPTDSKLFDQLSKALPDARTGTILGVNRPILDVSGKRAAQSSTNALTVDMESHLLARTASDHKIPFAVLRTVLDDAETNVPQPLFNALGKDGRIKLMVIVSALLRRKVTLGELLALRRLYSAASRSLLRCGAALRGLGD